MSKKQRERKKEAKTDTKTCRTILACKKTNSFVDGHKKYLEASKDIEEEEAAQEEELRLTKGLEGNDTNNKSRIKSKRAASTVQCLRCRQQK
eukprot:1915767-Ditylum_brightwellii.AAC.2